MNFGQYVTPSGTTVSVRLIGEASVPNFDSIGLQLEIRDVSGSIQKVEVRFPQTPIIEANMYQETGKSFDSDMRKDYAVAAALDAVDTRPDVFDKPPPYVITADVIGVLRLLHRPRLSDRELRRYLARRIYSGYAEGTLSTMVKFGQPDYILTGATEKDFIRNLEVLAEEDYLRLHLAMGPSLSGVQARAKLVREMELYGAPREDVVSERDYGSSLSNYASLDAERDALLLEYRRFINARTPRELISVFRAVTPLVESIARKLAQAHGSTRELPTLGPIIGELQARSVGGIALVSQLNHILKFGRDLVEHGQGLPEPVLRIAAENAFELVPQLGSLFPR